MNESPLYLNGEIKKEKKNPGICLARRHALLQKCKVVPLPTGENHGARGQSARAPVLLIPALALGGVDARLRAIQRYFWLWKTFNGKPSDLEAPPLALTADRLICCQKK